MCPKCKSENVATVATINGLWVERFKKCRACGHNFQTCELVRVDIKLIEYQKEVLSILQRGRRKQTRA